MEQWKGARVVDPLAARHALGNLKASLRLAAAPEQLQLGRYELGAVLGSGSFGKVYRARDPKLARDVALKLFHPEVFGTRESKDRARVEARALASMHHPHIVQVFDVGTVDQRFYIVMELVEGETVEAWIERTAPGPEAILDTFTQAAEGLAAAHAAGVLHLDFKPSNVMRTAEGHPAHRPDRPRAVLLGGAPRRPDRGDHRRPAGHSDEPTVPGPREAQPRPAEADARPRRGPGHGRGLADLGCTDPGRSQPGVTKKDRDTGGLGARSGCGAMDPSASRLAPGP